MPAGAGSIALGVYPPPIPTQAKGNPGPQADGGSPDSCPAGTTSYASGYPKYNILLIMVDEMRAPTFWLPATGGQQAIDNTIPNIAALRNKSFIFPNYFVAATVCGPSRACILTGLYSQQTCIFRSQGVKGIPSLMNYMDGWAEPDQPGFPTIGNVLSQSLPTADGPNASYDCAWIGKWHLSCLTGSPGDGVGANGPYDYGFGNPFSLPNSGVQYPNSYPRGEAGYPSPNGLQNAGNGGDFLDTLVTPGTYDVPFFNESAPTFTPSPTPQLNDAAIAYAFTHYWLPYAENNFSLPLAPWFCGVSFVNPHDIEWFPYAFGFTSGDFAPPKYPASPEYQPPPVLSTPWTYDGTHCAGGSTACASDGDVANIPAFPNPYGTVGSPDLPNPWNNSDNPSTQQYNPLVGGGGKPGLQTFFQGTSDDDFGTINTPNGDLSGWLQFLNYYFWLQSCVDTQVGNVISALKNSPFGSNTIIIFTSDHGDYAGSHSLHGKGGALYDESLNVPLYISYPGQRASAIVPYVCSSVDILPLVYTLALGNHSWRYNSQDLVSYLNGREAIVDGIGYYGGSTQLVPQRRISGIKLANPPGGSEDYNNYQPFVLHTADDFSFASTANGPQPSHAVAFRTVDITDNNYLPPYGGGKLGIYSYWYTCNPNLTNAPIVGLTGAAAPPQYEFYNYSQAPPGGLAPNPGEVGNQAFDSNGVLTQEASEYIDDFFYIGSPPGMSVWNELYNLNQTCPANLQVQAAIQAAFTNYKNYLESTRLMSDCNGLQVATCPTSCGS